MERRHQLALKVVGASLGLGLFGDGLFHQSAWGLNVFLWLFALVVTGWSIARNVASEAKPVTALLAVPTVLFALGYVLFDSPGAVLMCTIGTAVSLVMLAGYLRHLDIRRLSIGQATVGNVGNVLKMFLDPVFVFAEDVEWRILKQSKWSQHVSPYLRGAIVAIPIVVVFGVLLTQADPVFNKLTTQALTLNWDSLWAHAGLFLGFSALALMFLRRALLSPKSAVAPPTSSPARDHSIEAVVVALALDVLFLCFVAVQLKTFFWGAGFIKQTTGMSFAQYARQGFFQLVSVSALALPLLLALSAFVQSASAKQQATFRWSCAVMVSLLVLIMSSAFYRMGLYVSANGLTELRVYSTSFMVWLAIVFVVFSFTVLRGKPGRFVFLSLTSGLAAALVLMFSNPGRMIAEYNVGLLVKGGFFDPSYQTVLGADAAPSLIRALPYLKSEPRQMVSHWLQTGYAKGDSDWRGFNWSRSQAHAAVRHSRGLLIAEATAGPSGGGIASE